MLQQLSPAAPPAPGAPRGEANKDRPLVLVIEGDHDAAALYEAVLDDAGCVVTVLETALGAAARVRESRPRAIVLELALPYLSGTRFLRLLREDPATADIPVIVVSAVADLMPSRERAAVARVVAKPVEPAALVAALTNVIGTPQRAN